MPALSDINVADTLLTLPLSEAFSQGVFDASSTGDMADAFGRTVAGWGHIPVNNALIVIAILWVIVVSGRFLSILPYLLRSLSRYKENLRIEDNLRLSQERNYAALSMVIPFCLVVSRFSLLDSGLWSEIPPEWQTPAVIGVFTAYIIVRRLCLSVTPGIVVHRDKYAVANNSIRNYFVLAVCLMGLTAGLGVKCGFNYLSVRYMLVAEMVLMMLVYLYAKWHIVARMCGHFGQIVYLCGLELIPAGLIVASVLLL